MSQHDMNLIDQAGAAFLTDLNAALVALVANSSGATEPATMFAYQFWVDTTTGLLKIRNAANSAWVTIGSLGAVNLGLASLAGCTFTGPIVGTSAQFPSGVDAPVAQNSKSVNYTTVLADANRHLYHPVADNNPRTFTIDSNANVTYPVGTTLIFVNKVNVLTIAITSDTLVWAGSGATGSRSLAANGLATAFKDTTTSWLISGTGLS